ncbi:MAG: tRNA dihydrouridine synthase DusB [Gammaproteobacteria bacterium]|nr:tRNA dihydrouridine synthase DusB [Gammaproteobacteria bacterium]MDH3506229.1 tRNA dihydrouridine synthase DusB [Gammaproteobacteria bacterium]
MRIGNLQFSNNIALAPMAGISDPPFRELCARLGAGLTPSEMVSADVGLWNSKKSRYRLRRWGNRTTQIVQIAGYDPAMLAEAAARAEQLGAAAIDINLGCPAKKVCRRLAGSALLNDPPLIARIFRRVVERVSVPVTAKIRTGWSPERRNGVEIARIAEEQGIAALTVHGRTRACKFGGHAEYDTIRKIKRAISIPVIANGDIDSAAKARDVLEYTGADGVMIGRAARGRPWIFSDIGSQLIAASTRDENLSLFFVRDIILEHLDGLYSFYGESTGVRVSRKHLSWYSQHQEGGRCFREHVMAVETAREQLRLTQEFFYKIAREAEAERERSRGERSGENGKQQKNLKEKEEEKVCNRQAGDGCKESAA